MLAPAGRLECAPAGFPASSAYPDRSQSHAIASPSIGGRGRRPELGAQCRPKKKAAGAAFLSLDGPHEVHAQGRGVGGAKPSGTFRKYRSEEAPCP